MRYMGNKRRFAKELLPIILKDRKPGQWYVEPFVGGFNVICEVEEGPRLASDNHYYLIELFKAIQRGWVPPSFVSENDYYDIKEGKADYPPWLVGFVGFGCSFGGRWFSSYARGEQASLRIQNFADESSRSLLRLVEKLQDIEVKHLDYDRLQIPSNSIVYCDPPYKGTAQYTTRFNHNKFWEWIRGLVVQGHQVFVSEYEAPEDFVSVWSKVRRSKMNKNTKQDVEHLWVLLSGYKI